MRASLQDVLAQTAPGGAVAAFTCYDVETAAAASAAARRRPVVLLVAERAFTSSGGDALLAAICGVADAAAAAVAVQLDHCGDLAVIERAVAGGATAVMADAARLPFEENIEFVRAAVATVGARGVSVEAELGRLEGHEDAASDARAGALTDPQQAARFCEATGCHCLAVSIGNVHGRYATPPALDWARLHEIGRLVDVPLSLHGASGLPHDDVRRAVGAGIAKVNVNTELREAYLAATTTALEGVLPAANLLELHAAQRAAVAEVCARKLALLGQGGSERA